MCLNNSEYKHYKLNTNDLKLLKQTLMELSGIFRWISAVFFHAIFGYYLMEFGGIVLAHIYSCVL